MIVVLWTCAVNSPLMSRFLTELSVYFSGPLFQFWAKAENQDAAVHNTETARKLINLIFS